MHPHFRHMVIDADFDQVIVDLLRAFQEQRLEIVARIDVREHCRRTLGRDFRRHLIFDVWSPDLGVEAVRQDLETGTFVMTRFVIYELADGETAVTATEGLWWLASDPAYRREHAQLVTLAELQRERAGQVLRSLRRKTKKAA
jgi:uncharacterized protein (DUF302 family)